MEVLLDSRVLSSTKLGSLGWELWLPYQLMIWTKESQSHHMNLKKYAMINITCCPNLQSKEFALSKSQMEFKNNQASFKEQKLQVRLHNSWTEDLKM